MYYYVRYCENGVTFDLYAKTLKDGEALALQLIAEGHEGVRVIEQRKRDIAHLIHAHATNAPM